MKLPFIERYMGDLFSLIPMEKTRITRSVWWGYFPVALVTVTGLLISIAAFNQSLSWEKSQVEIAFNVASQDRILVVQREFRHSLGIVQDIASFFEASEIVDRREFRKFVGPALKNQAGIKLLEWVPVVHEKDRSVFIKKARQSFPPYRIKEVDYSGELIDSQGHPIYYPVLYVQPYKSNKDTLGLNLGADANVSALMKKAEVTRSLQVSSGFPFADKTKEKSQVIVVVPVFLRNVSSEETQIDAPRQIRGFAIGVFYIDEIVERALESLRSGGVDLHFYQEHPDQDGELLYTHLSRLRRGLLSSAEADVSDITYRQQIPIGTLQWEVVCNPAPGKFQIETWNSWVIISGGIAFTLLLIIYLTTLVGRARQVKLEVEERTSQLQEAVQALNWEIMERKSAERELQSLNETLEDSVANRTAEAERRAEYLEQFAYVASHDLKAPLRAVSNLAGWIEEDLADRLDNSSKEQLALLRNRVLRMHDLIEGLLEYSRVGGNTDVEDRIDCRELLNEITDSLSPPEGFKIKIKGEMPIVYTDRLQFGQVFSNLISNSLKHHGGEKGKVRISSETHEDYYQFSVCDDGQGIAPEYHDKIFLMFQTLKSSDYENSTGIGLALVKKIIGEHGGAIRLESAPGEGTCFHFTWPKKDSSR